MNYSRGSHWHSRKNSGAALVITLAVLVIMAIMVVSLSDIMRIERGAARSHVEKARAEILARIPMDHVLGTLEAQTTDTTRNWISQPGQLVASQPSQSGGSSKILPVSTPVPLSSGAPATSPTSSKQPPYFQPANLNIALFGAQSNIITGALPPHLITEDPDPANSNNALPMLLNWIYVRQDGSEDVSPQPDTTSTANPIVGRYAYWTDDESSKVNYNLAWKRNNNPNPASHPTQINLPSLLGTDPSVTEPLADAIHLFKASPPGIQTAPTTTTAYKALNRFFYNTPEDARRVQAIKDGVYSALSQAKFSVTHYNSDPDTTFFNEPRFVLTTQASRAGTQASAANGPLFLDILNTANSDPGLISSINQAKLQKVIDKLDSYLSRTDWPIATGSTASFQAKYYGGNAQRLKQLSLNIVDYVRSKESKQALVAPLRFAYPQGGSLAIGIAVDANSFIGSTRGPLITELGLFIPQNPTSPTTPQTYAAKLKVEIYVPPNFGISSLDLTKLTMFQNLFVDKSDTDNESMNVFPPEAVITAAEITMAPSGNPLKAGDRAVISRNVTITYPTGGGRPTKASNVLLRIAISQQSTGDRLNIAPLIDGSSNFIKCPVNAPAVPENMMPSVEVDDPRVNSFKSDWKIATAPSAGAAPNTFGSVNSVSTLHQPPTANPAIVPEQDVDVSGNITDISLVMPAPAGTTGNTLSANPDGIMASSGELGFLSTGMQSAAAAGIPWRTLHLQPSQQPTSIVPDWAFMDLFTVPADVPSTGVQLPTTFYSPHGNSTGGRVNMNAHPVPFTMDRIAPLAAVFEKARSTATDLTKTVDSATAQTIANNVYNRTLAIANKGSSAGKSYGYPAGFDSPGEVVEIKGVADGGEESEQLVRDIANLITARGNVFSVYTIGQALKQTSNHQLVTTGEQRQQAMFERYLDPNTNSVHFHQVYFRNLLP